MSNILWQSRCYSWLKMSRFFSSLSQGAKTFFQENAAWQSIFTESSAKSFFKGFFLKQLIFRFFRSISHFLWYQNCTLLFSFIFIYKKRNVHIIKRFNVPYFLKFQLYFWRYQVQKEKRLFLLGGITYSLSKSSYKNKGLYSCFFI